MKKSQLRQLIREEISSLAENPEDFNLLTVQYSVPLVCYYDRKDFESTEEWVEFYTKLKNKDEKFIKEIKADLSEELRDNFEEFESNKIKYKLSNE